MNSNPIKLTSIKMYAASAAPQEHSLPLRPSVTAIIRLLTLFCQGNRFIITALWRPGDTLITHILAGQHAQLLFNTCRLMRFAPSHLRAHIAGSLLICERSAQEVQLTTAPHFGNAPYCTWGQCRCIGLWGIAGVSTGIAIFT